MSTITREEVLKMDLKSIHAAIKDPKTSAEMQNLMRDRGVVSRISELMLEAQNREAAVDAELERTVPPTTEELAEQARASAAEPAVTKSLAESVAEAFVPVVAAPEPPAPARVKIVREYQVRDENGKPIGRPTKIEAWSMEELVEKMQVAHESATRAFHRLKQQKLTFKQDRTILSPEAIKEAARLALEAKDPDKVTDVIHAAIESEYQKQEEELKKKQVYEEGRAITNEFLRRHLRDFNPCEANKKAIGDYFTEHNLEFTLDNLEAAFQDLLEQGDKLAVAEAPATRQATEDPNPVPVATAASPVTPVIPVADATIAVPTSVAPAPPPAPSQPVAEATAPTPAAASNVPTPARRPAVNGGIAPGTLSAQRPGTPDPALTRKEFLKTVREMKPDVMKMKLKTDPQFVKQLESYGIKVR